MNSSFLFLLLASILIFAIEFDDASAQSQADVYRGDSYQDVDNGDGTHTWIGGLPLMIDSGNTDSIGRKIYTAYKATDTGSTIKLESGIASISYDKQGCYAEIYNGGLIDRPSIVSFDRYVIYTSTDGISFSPLNVINNASCTNGTIQYNSTSSEIFSEKNVPNVGKIKTRYLQNLGNNLKTQLELTNLSSFTDRYLGLEQNIGIPQNIEWGNTTVDLGDHIGQIFDRAFLVNNEAKLLKLAGGLDFSVVDAWDNLDHVTINSVNNGIADVSFFYFRNPVIVQPGQTVTIDPTFSSNNPTDDGYVLTNSSTSTSCSTPSTIFDTTPEISTFLGESDVNNYCKAGFFEWDLSSINDLAVITDSHFKHDMDSVFGSANCDLQSLESRPSLGTASSIWSDIFDGTVFVSSNWCATVGDNTDVDLGPDADSYFQSQLSSDWGGFGFHFTDMTRQPGVFTSSSISSEDYGSATPKPTLELTYVVPNPAEFEIAFANESVGDIVAAIGTLTVNDGYYINVTSIRYYDNGTLINTNSTGQIVTSFPTVINLGPFYSQQKTNASFNHTFAVDVYDSYSAMHTNSSYSLFPREYDPDYFTAIDPTQGQVNYTFSDSNYLQVNRDKNGTTFNVECQYFTQADAFFDNLENGTWNNQTGIYYYNEDAGDYYYLRCYNDGELFVTSVPQNFTNALVPGLAIFDQLGGFFGAPSIILVILSILSLGTGRNYPIILLIAASVTGILLALELLTLDPGLVVALIVISGIGLFGIRKFY